MISRFNVAIKNRNALYSRHQNRNRLYARECKVIIAGFGYLIDVVTFFLLPNYDATIATVTFIGELLLPFWLLIKGVNVEQWEKRTLESA